MENWDLNDSFDKLGSAYIKAYDEENNIALDISGYLIIRHDIILYNGLSLNNTLTQLQTQYNNISISGLLNSITYLNSVDTYFNYYVSTLSGQINSINNNLNTYGSITNLMNNVTYLNTYSVSLSGIVNNNYYYQGSLNIYNILHRTTLSYIVNNNYYNQGALNNYNILHRTSLSYIVNNNYYNQGKLNNYNTL